MFQIMIVLPHPSQSYCYLNLRLIALSDLLILPSSLKLKLLNPHSMSSYHGFTSRWWQDWLEYVNQTSIVNDGTSSEQQGLVSSSALKKPSCIDNSDLIDEALSEDSAMGNELHDTLVEGTDYILLPKEVWNKLHSW